MEGTLLQKYDREELYHKVWEQPLLRVAEEYGVSAVALGKTCRKLSVPVPGRGHWAKLAHGHPGVKRPPLPKLDKVPVIYRSPVIQKKPTNSDQDDPELTAINNLLSSGALAPPPIEPSARPHPLMRITMSRLRNHSRKDETGILLPREPGALDIKVSEATLERALQLMARIVAVLERHGFSVEVSEKGSTVAAINGERISFGIEEAIRRVVTQKPRVPNPTDRWDYDEIVTHEPAGKLALLIRSETWTQYEQRVRWSDAKVQRVEQLISDFVAGLMRTAVILRRQEKERKLGEVEQERRAQEREQLRKDIEKEEKKVKQFNSWIEGWERAEQLRRFIAAYAEKSRCWDGADQERHKAWIDWATQQADRIDPFVSEKPVSVLDRRHELSPW
jgi:hypothetical protein